MEEVFSRGVTGSDSGNICLQYITLSPGRVAVNTLAVVLCHLCRIVSMDLVLYSVVALKITF